MDFDDFDESVYEDVGEKELYAVYVMPVGQNADGLNIYHLFFSSNPDDTFAEGWSEKPACIMAPLLMVPQENYDCVKELKTTVKLDVAQQNCCFSMQDCRDHCVALASENLDEADEYPEPVRIVIQYGDHVDDVESMLARRDMALRVV